MSYYKKQLIELFTNTPYFDLALTYTGEPEILPSKEFKELTHFNADKVIILHIDKTILRISGVNDIEVEEQKGVNGEENVCLIFSVSGDDPYESCSFMVFVQVGVPVKLQVILDEWSEDDEKENDRLLGEYELEKQGGG